MSDPIQKQSFDPPRGRVQGPVKDSEIYFWLVMKTDSSEEVKRATEADVVALKTESFEIFNSEAEAQARREEIKRSRVLRKAQIIRAKAKVERDRAAFAGTFPKAAAQLSRREEEARFESALLVEERSKARRKQVDEISV